MEGIDARCHVIGGPNLRQYLILVGYRAFLIDVDVLHHRNGIPLRIQNPLAFLIGFICGQVHRLYIAF